MRNKICIKCNSNKIVKVPDKSRLNNSVSINAFTVATSSKYICCDCGYFEEYFEKQKDRDALYDTFKNNSL